MIINLAPVHIGRSACISQRAVLCTGSHDYSKTTFDLITREIVLQDGSWIAASAWVGPGVTVGSHAILTAGSVTSKDLPQRCLTDFRLWDEYERQALRRARWSRSVTYDLPGRSNVN